MRFLAAIGLLGLVSCSAGPTRPEKVSCTLDSQCAKGEVCFLDGCGDPTKGVVVEVQGTLSTQLAQDFTLGDGFKPPVNLTLMGPTALVGEIVRDGAVYTQTVTVKAHGESELIPGQVRSYQGTFTALQHGLYSLPVGAGKFVVTAEASDDLSIPPELKAITSIPGQNANLSFSLTPVDGALVITNLLLKRIDPGPPESRILIAAAMDVQAFDPVTHQPLSQRVNVSTTYGEFTLFVSPAARQLNAFELVATPRDPDSLVPSKIFTVNPAALQTTPYVMGDFGDPLPLLSGELKTVSGDPVVGASVYLEGPVNGGGVFRSKLAITDSKGVYRLDLLPSAADGAYLVTALPPTSSSAGVVQGLVKAVSKVGQLSLLTPTKITCPDKIMVSGVVHRPDGTNAINLKVVARAVEQLEELGDQPLPMGDAEAVTDGNGRFSLGLDPGIYQIDFKPGKDLPRTTRQVIVPTNMGGADAGAASLVLSVLTLSKGRVVTGTISLPSTPGTMAPPPAINASVTYYRVTQVGGRTSSLVVGTAVTDDTGAYSLILPTR